MTVNIVLIVVIGVTFACGVTLLLERSLTRIVVGTLLVGNAVNLIFIVASGAPGRAPIVDESDPSPMSDPLPQAMVLTAIVITLGVAAFLLAMAYRSWQLEGHDEVQDDVEDRLIMRLADLDEASQSYEEGTGDPDEEGADTEGAQR
ncbi:Na(+)/H(+) antiporter subunit C [Mumia sp. zg.B53]|uniref:Na(+)/H(+) antiporter subunit C n=1 Tax=unclassified Mumia TaxID=2621872 RepID=UPI001C6E1C64|nr:MULTISPECIES: Na(+)/H(+) antiporter subunit C [unclassified Mumia]MBW9207256.1 Na(+)/H(+) antiporter subunit C [Mumia sp. zg.B17]MBW9210396.1 Na(+)/H(+) antiporter subunit C [Mumia sp. zg.B21]MBW9215018.1 Na(+)/H(+) antiporter subunit C [Mumia sp. zg.B53]MDD9348718.1 Na(+)/H(+) antiporter subunit C [Mumia sp.]